MEIAIYTMPTCTACILLKTLLKRTNVTVVEYTVGEDITMEEFKEKYPQVYALPLAVFEDIQYISIKQLTKKLIEKGLIQVPNK